MRARVEAAATALSIALAIVSGCSRERRHEVLSFFFDGVPALDGSRGPAREVSSQYIQDTAAPPTPLNMFRHEPYQKNNCTACHPRDRSLFLEEDYDRRGRCFGCHEHDAFRVRVESLPFLHGPVAAGSCLACHDAHESLHPGLLAAPDPKLCYSCHEKEAVGSSPAHGGQVEPCLVCHDPHGGSDRSFLRGVARQ